MGCFNTTGFISRLPINYGDRVVCIIATMNQNCSGRCLYYPDSMVSPWCLPIYGTYDDYGCIENIEKTYQTEKIEKVFDMSIEEVIHTIERCLSGTSVDDEIKRCKKYKNKEELKMYEKLLNMFDNNGWNIHIDFYKTFAKKKLDKHPCPILLFEHADIYDKIASEGMTMKMFNGKTVINMIEQSLKAVNLDIEIDELMGREIGITTNHLFRDSYFGYDMRKIDIDDFENDEEVNQIKEELSDVISELANKNNLSEESYDNEEKSPTYTSEQREIIKKKLDDLDEIRTKHKDYHWHHEGDSPLMMGILDMLNKRSYHDMLNKHIADFCKFAGLLRWMGSIPLYIIPSQTGSQETGYKQLSTLFSACLEHVTERQKEYEED